jgi:tetratricopeptide (TPR) repeat protein
VTGSRLDEILDDYVRAAKAGRAPDRDALLARHPALAPELSEALRGLDFVGGVAAGLREATEPEARPGRALGDYRLLREVGRGGMAVVYEAEQLSLGRRVAVKVLPFAAVLDPKQLQRFKNEAVAAANLRHPHIVPVYGVGCDRGVHYYAMQFVEGQSLASAIDDMRRPGPHGGAKTPISSHGSNRHPAYVRMAARLGVQAAEALDHAHQVGVVHRDVKPANVLVDHAGSLWVTDFGLARSRQDAGLTMTGEIVGTIRYMSPEQALAKRVPVDHRTDVYSLGATLYELFTLEPAFPGDDAARVMRDVMEREPAPPRRLNPAIPVDLETVLLKAMAKDPASRYATAQEMALDLERFLDDEPVLARRPSPLARAAGWSRRHRGLVASTFAVLLLAVAAVAVDAARVREEQRRTSDALDQATGNLTLARKNMRLAREAVDRFLWEAGVATFSDQPLPPPAKRALLEAAREFFANDVENPDALGNLAAIEHALRRYPEALAYIERQCDRAPRDAAALAERGHMLGHLGRHDEALSALDRALAVDPGLARAHMLRGLELSALGHLPEAVVAYRKAIAIRPDAPAHVNLGNALENQGEHDAAIAAYEEATRLDPHDPVAWRGLGAARAKKGDRERAIGAYREAIRVSPDFAEAHNDLGLLLRKDRDLKSAIREFKEAIRFGPTLSEPHFNLGLAYADTDDSENAMAEFREVVRLEPGHADAYDSLGAELGKRGDLPGAIERFRQAIDRDPDHRGARGHLAYALRQKGDVDAALAEIAEMIRRKPGDAGAHVERGVCLQAKRDLDGAIAAYREAIRLRRDVPDAHVNLGVCLEGRGDLEDAIAVYRECVAIRPEEAEALCNLGLALQRQGKLPEALVHLRKGHALGSRQAGWGYPSADWVRSAERMLELEPRLESVLSKATRPKDARERIEFATLLHAKGRYEDATRLYEEAFAESPELVEDVVEGYRVGAARSAVLAASGPGGAARRGQALGWLRAELRARTKAGFGASLQDWKDDPDLLPVRERIADLPEPERADWRSLWAAVDAAMKAVLPPAK